jgi:RNA polymerase sigma-70 factor (ECF subfamily)
MADFDDVYRRHLPSVFRYAVRCVGRRDIAEELAADAFLKLYRAFDSIDLNQLPGWLLTIVRHAAVDYWRHRTTEQRYLATLQMEPVSSAAPSVQEWLDSVPALNPMHRVCLVLRYVHGLPRTDIARRLNLSDTQVKGYLQYARELMRKELVHLE